MESRLQSAIQVVVSNGNEFIVSTDTPFDYLLGCTLEINGSYIRNNSNTFPQDYTASDVLVDENENVIHGSSYLIPTSYVPRSDVYGAIDSFSESYDISDIYLKSQIDLRFPVDGKYYAEGYLLPPLVKDKSYYSIFSEELPFASSFNILYPLLSSVGLRKDSSR